MSLTSIFGLIDAAADRELTLARKLNDVCLQAAELMPEVIQHQAVFECILAEWPSGGGNGELGLGIGKAEGMWAIAESLPKAELKRQFGYRAWKLLD